MAALSIHGKKAIITYRLTDPHPGCGSGKRAISIKNRRGKVVKKLTISHLPTNTARTWQFICRLTKGRCSILANGSDTAGNKAAKATTVSLTVKQRYFRRGREHLTHHDALRLIRSHRRPGGRRWLAAIEADGGLLHSSAYVC